MLYFKVKPEYDNKYYTESHITPKGRTKVRSRFLVGDELYTETEVVKKKVPQKCVDMVNVKKTDTYWCFGCRFGA